MAENAMLDSEKFNWVSPKNLLSHTFKILELYPGHLNVYGDIGNSTVLKSRFEMYGLKAKIVEHNVGDKFPEPDQFDLILGGGGQDKQQMLIKDDLLANKEKIREAADKGVPMLVICGMYQLFGNYFEPIQGQRIDGLEILDVFTVGKVDRLIGNIITKSSSFGELVGYENHSGQTYLNKGATPLAQKVLLGEGNNYDEDTEGCIKNNVIGTYLHGPLLPKNPKLSDFLIDRATENLLGKPVQLTSIKADAVDEVSLIARSAVFEAGR
jgi:CobQ-like glutamine amidotransferase family enzyme